MPFTDPEKRKAYIRSYSEKNRERLLVQKKTIMKQTKSGIRSWEQKDI